MRSNRDNQKKICAQRSIKGAKIFVLSKSQCALDFHNLPCSTRWKSRWKVNTLFSLVSLVCIQIFLTQISPQQSFKLPWLSESLTLCVHQDCMSNKIISSFHLHPFLHKTFFLNSCLAGILQLTPCTLQCFLTAS